MKRRYVSSVYQKNIEKTYIPSGVISSSALENSWKFHISCDVFSIFKLHWDSPAIALVARSLIHDCEGGTSDTINNLGMVTMAVNPTFSMIGHGCTMANVGKQIKPHTYHRCRSCSPPTSKDLSFWEMHNLHRYPWSMLVIYHMKYPMNNRNWADGPQQNATAKSSAENAHRDSPDNEPHESSAESWSAMWVALNHPPVTMNL